MGAPVSLLGCCGADYFRWGDRVLFGEIFVERLALASLPRAHFENTKPIPNMKTTTENTAGSDCPAATCSPFFEFRQNNSGGSFDDPAVFVYIEAPDLETARSRTEPHFTLCGDSGLYAEYDACGCCPCCGHRWSDPWDDKGETVEEVLKTIDENGLSYMGTTAIALIKADGSLIKGDSDENLAAIRGYVSSVNAGDSRS